jgi:hypothetical protein
MSCDGLCNGPHVQLGLNVRLPTTQQGSSAFQTCSSKPTWPLEAPPPNPPVPRATPTRLASHLAGAIRPAQLSPEGSKGDVLHPRGSAPPPPGSHQAAPSLLGHPVAPPGGQGLDCHHPTRPSRHASIQPPTSDDLIPPCGGHVAALDGIGAVLPARAPLPAARSDLPAAPAGPPANLWTGAITATRRLQQAIGVPLAVPLTHPDSKPPLPNGILQGVRVPCLLSWHDHALGMTCRHAATLSSTIVAPFCSPTLLVHATGICSRCPWTMYTLAANVTGHSLEPQSYMSQHFLVAQCQRQDRTSACTS